VRIVIAERLLRRLRRTFARPPVAISDVHRSADTLAALLAADDPLWSKARTSADGPRVLIATNVTGFQHASLLESVLAAALTLRGAQVHVAVCDAMLPACLKVEQHAINPASILDDKLASVLCGPCQATGLHHFDALGLPVHRFSTLITTERRAEVREWVSTLRPDELALIRNGTGDKVGMQGSAGALRYFARSDLPESNVAQGVLRRFVEAAILTADAYDALLAREQFDVAVFHHGIYVPQGPAGDALRRHRVRVVNWNPSYRRSTFIFSEGDSYHYTLMEEPTAIWEGMLWSDDNAAQIADYLISRAVGTRDWIWFHENPDADVAGFAREIGLDPSRPIIGMLSNVAWDAQLHYPANAFPNMIDWVFRTIEYFAGRPDLQLLLRIHPAEIRGTVPTAQPLAEEIRRRFPALPPNVFVIPPESNVSTYAAMSLCDSVIIYGTKMGVELTAVGIPVVVAGEAWIRNKGLTLDAADAADYFRKLDTLPLGRRLDDTTRQKAMKYAYHFFFRRMIPVPFIVPTEGKIYGLALNTLRQLLPGHHPGLDVICDGILHAAPFVYPAEQLGLGE
jgi:hypothetical protein